MISENNLIATIKISSIPGSIKQTADIEMPVWFQKSEDGKIRISLALFGGINTIAKNEADIDAAIKEAVEGFFHAAETFGKGIREELTLLGWAMKKNSIRFKVKSRDRRPAPRLYNFSPIQPAYKEMMRTGKPKNISVQL